MPADTIVVGTDGSPTADKAVDKAAEIAVALGAPVDLVTAFDSMSNSAVLASAGGLAIDPTAAVEGSRSQAESVLASTADRLRAHGVDVRQHLCSGNPADALINVASDTGAQMIVVGNRGMVGARRVLGSVPNRVSHHASCCVLIVHTC